MFSYEAIPGFFAQDDPLADAASIGAVSPFASPFVPARFGLLDSSSQRWSTLLSRLRALNAASGATGTVYKLFFFGRHGQGYHNVAEDKYGTKAWDDYWAMLNGDGELTWGPDPELTALGLAQATVASNMWKSELRDAQIPRPDSFFCSPLTRAMQTAVTTFWGTFNDVRILVVENCREEHGEHTCDKRSTRTQIESTFSIIREDELRFEFEPGFTETDTIWLPDVRETKPQATERAKGVLDRIFLENSEALFISITAHSGIINAFLHAMGRARYALPTGGVLPVVVRATKVN
ncbi:F-box domain-containing protein [Mycena sanguinolenta]|uniref:F-box domain-containing protein n=1 Tax=Mycena sanguinolenta TaxID=230812 RepID=A0A8H6YEF8_9AGAR|nr:F-box domain-containing protein [Mycena sanguinolenta]